MKEIIEALEKEAADAAQYMEDALAYDNSVEASFWRGYLNATNNAAALIYGPTPLDESERN